MPFIDDEEDEKVDHRDDDKEKSAGRSDHLLKLIISQSVNGSAWIKYLIAIQGGFGLSFGYLLRKDSGSVQDTTVPLCIIIAICGAVTSVVLSQIIRRQYQWSAWYIHSYMSREGGEPHTVFPTRPRAVIELEPGYTATRVRWFCEFLVLVWIMAACVSIWAASR